VLSYGGMFADAVILEELSSIFKFTQYPRENASLISLTKKIGGVGL